MYTDKTLLIGEIGLSHEGSLGMALSMIEACKEANLDYVKFQYHHPDFESTLDEKFRVKVFPQDLSRYDYWSRTSFNENNWKKIIEFCKKIDIGFLCTPFSTWAAQQLIYLGIKEVKISSGDANNWELLEFAKLNFDKIIISVGMSTRNEVSGLIDFMRDYQGEYLIMQCTSSYPVEPKNVGMTYFQEILNTTGSVGLSDHTGNPMVSMAAIAMQASMVEFHVVFSKKQFGPDSSSSITFQDALTISQFRDIWCDIFDLNYDKDLIAKKLEDTRIKFGRGLSLKRDLKKGELVKEDLFTLKKPQGPLNWMQRSQFYGLRASRDLNSNQHLAINDFE